MSRWFRHYAGMMRDEKLVRAAVKSKQPVERVVWVWGAILESASEINDAGRYDFGAEEAAYFLRCDPADVASILDALEALGRLDAGRVAKWGDRQFDSDASRERQKRYRDRLKPSPSDNGDVTPPSRDDEMTPQEADTEEEAESREEEEQDHISLDAEREFDLWYSDYPRHVGKGQARKAYRLARKKAGANVLLAGALAAAVQYAGKEPQYIPHPATWLNGERWEDDKSPGATGETEMRDRNGYTRDDPMFGVL